MVTCWTWFGLLLGAAHVTSSIFTPSVVQPGHRTVLRHQGTSTLYRVDSPGYSSPFLVLNVSGATRHAIGYSYGALLANEIVADWGYLMNATLPNLAERDVLLLFLDYEWDVYLHKQLPAAYGEEIQGVDDGALSVGVKGIRRLVHRGLVISSFPGDIEKDIEWLLRDQAVWGPRIRAAARQHSPFANVGDLLRSASKQLTTLFGKGCSHFGVWGPRTSVGDSDRGELYSGRNLDWQANTGIAVNKLITVVHPPRESGTPGYPHAAIGFAGIYGALTGMSKAGITVHEAGDDNKRETLDGFAWVLRLRYVMERARTMADALELWRATNNTLGINHGLGSGVDARYVALETCAGYTAYFSDNDPREANFTRDGHPLGSGLPHAVWRTNHGYDPIFRQSAMDAYPGGDTLTRYWLLHDTINGYGIAEHPIGPLEAVNLTAVVGDKGGSHLPSFLTCADAAKGSNIISATFHPSSSTMWVAFEDGRDQHHVPACCQPYLQFDMKPYWG